MFLANLSLVELLALAGVLSAATVALYLWTRSRRKIQVSTLRFWQAALQSPDQARRRRIDQPLSLLLQLLGMLLLLLAIAQPRIGSPGWTGRDHVLLLDVSASSALRGSTGLVIDAERKRAREWLSRLGSQDRVLLVRAGSVPEAATALANKRAEVEDALAASTPTYGSLALAPAIDLARQTLRLSSQNPGEIVYVGPGLLPQDPQEDIPAVPNLRVLTVAASAPNLGIHKVLLRRSGTAPDAWEGIAVVRNTGTVPLRSEVILGLGGSPMGLRNVALAPGAETELPLSFRAGAAAWLDVRLSLKDGLAADNAVRLELPAPGRLLVDVFSDEPDLLRPVFAADSRVEARYRPASEVNAPTDAALVVYDRVAPAASPKTDSFWIEPPPGSSPVPARRAQGTVALDRWTSVGWQNPGLRTTGLKLNAPIVFEPAAGDLALAEGGKGALAVARPGAVKTLVLGFHPARTSLRYELGTPLLFAAILEWFAPQVFTRQETAAGSPGLVRMELPPAPQGSTQVRAEDGASVPFSFRDGELQFFAGSPGLVRIRSGSTEQALSLTLPDPGIRRWEIAAGAARNLPEATIATAVPGEVWKWLALLGIAILAFEYWKYGRTAQPLSAVGRVSFVLKVAMILAGLAALLEPVTQVRETKLAVGALADTSDSIPLADLASSSEWLTALANERGRHRLDVLPFASSLRALSNPETKDGIKLRGTAGADGRATNLESAIREGLASLPAGMVPRLVLVSDGLETRGSAVRAAWQARQLGVPIDTVPLDGRPAPKLKLDAVRFPPTAFAGERFPIDLLVESPGAQIASLELTAEGKSVGSKEVALEAGRNQVRVFASISTPGAIDVAGTLRAAGLGDIRFEEAVTLARPKLLYVSGDPGVMARNLLGALQTARFEITESPDVPVAKLADYQIIVLNNIDTDGLPPARKADLERYVQDGGGLLVLGGERNVYREKKPGTPLDPLERTLPATIAPPQSPEGSVIVLIVDKSSSMEGRKMELARLAAIGVIENLKPADTVGVLIFDNSNQWAVPLRKAEDKTLIKRLIAGITPDGGTQIAPALAEGFKRAAPAKGTFRHVVLLTDGISEEGDSMSIARDAAAQKVTISTVGLGQDVNRAYLEKVAATAGGKSYFLSDPSGLEQILIRDVREFTGMTAVEKPLSPIVVKDADILAGIPIRTAPPLKGYVRYTSKPTADVLLKMDKDDPLFARWQYGLGRAAVFTSDAKSRWAEQWIGWPGYDRFWANVARDLLPHARTGETDLAYDPASGQLTAEYRLSGNLQSAAQPPALFVLGPDSFRAPMRLEKAGESLYRGRTFIGARKGMFRVRPLEDNAAFPEAGIYLPEPELTEWGNNEDLLRLISAYTGGHVRPTAAQVFSSGGRSIQGILNLWPGLLGLAILFNLAEVAWRRIRGARSIRTAPLQRAA